MPYLTSDKERFMHKLFSTIAPRYDLLNSLLSFNQDRYWRKIAIEHTSLKRGQSCLDVCCGTGKLTIALADKVGQTGQVAGLDFCQNMLDIASEAVAKTAYPVVVQLIQGNALQLPFDDESFDCATIAFGLRNVPDIKRTFSEMRRVVKSNGKIVVLELAKPRIPILKQLYYLYFEQLLPLLGKIGLGQDGPYRWLPESLRNLPDQSVICEIFQSSGLTQVECHELTGGIAAVYVGTKKI